MVPPTLQRFLNASTPLPQQPCNKHRSCIRHLAFFNLCYVAEDHHEDLTRLASVEQARAQNLTQLIETRDLGPQRSNGCKERQRIEEGQHLAIDQVLMRLDLS